LPCNRWRRVLFLWADRERESLPFGPVERHLGDCPECRERAERVERLILVVRTRCRRLAAPDGLVERIRVTIGRDRSREELR
jgi:predicted anti-sigma-YlaC factor YlaD